MKKEWNLRACVNDVTVSQLLRYSLVRAVGTCTTCKNKTCLLLTPHSQPALGKLAPLGEQAQGSPLADQFCNIYNLCPVITR
jgi:hypothetical protein